MFFHVADELCGPKCSKMTCIFCVDGTLCGKFNNRKMARALQRVPSLHVLVQKLPLNGLKHGVHFLAVVLTDIDAFAKPTNKQSWEQ